MRQFIAAGALLIAAQAGVPALQAAVPSSQREALISIYNATGGSNWTNRTGWLGAAGTECEWYGVQCDEQRANVDVLFLFENNLTGTIPQSIGNLTKLRSLQLYSNNLTGEIPSSIGQLTELQSVFLTNNQLDGRIPQSIGALTKLTNFQANGNRLDGPLPSSIADLSALEYLDLSYNEITGPLPDFSRLANLEYLALAVNQFSADIPRFGPKIQRIDFADNQLTGTIPAHLGTLQSLLYLRLSYNRLEGGIPPQLGQLQALETLDLRNNPLGGSIPAALGDLRSIKFIDLVSDQLTGTIPGELYRLTTLEELHLDDNALEGQISDDIGDLQNLVKLSLSANKLSGPLPLALTTLAKLDTLELLNNDLSGPIPPEIARLQNLTYIDLGANAFTGTIPPQFGSMPRLTFLSLYENQLEGMIPAELGKLSELTTLFLASNKLHGPIPDALRSLTRLIRFNVNGNALTGNVPAWIGELAQLEELDLSDNRLGGPLPAGLSSLGNLYLLSLSHNELTGPLPDFAAFPKMLYLYLGANEFSGGIPESIGAMSDLIDLQLGGNALTGPLPRTIGNLTNLDFLDVGDNSLDGPLPAEIGLLRKAYNIGLSGNRFSGTIPKELGDLSGNLLFLGLSFNAFKGEIPREITKLVNLEDGRSDFSYNAIYTSDSGVRAFVNSKHYDGDFEATQTVAPTDVRVTQTTDRSTTLTWTPIEYNYNPGGYQVTVSKSSGGPPVLVSTTANKDATSITVRNLEPSTRYFFTVATVTHPHPFQKSLLVSDPAPQQQATTGPRVTAPAEVVISEAPEGLVQIDGVEAVADRFTLTNFGDLATTVTLERGGDFFTFTPEQFSLAGGATRVVTLKSEPRPPGTYYGHVVVRGEGVADETIAYVVLLSVRRPAGTVIAQPIKTTIELVGQPGSDAIGVAQFRNAGTAELTGIVVSDQPWVVPDPQPITIAPGTIGSVNFRVVRSKRPIGAEGTLTANLSLVYVDGGSAAGIGLTNTTSGVSVSKVTVIDTTKPPVTPGTIPSLGAGELPLFIPGILNIGNRRSDLSLVNAFGGSAIGDLKLYFSSGSSTSIASLQPLRATESVNLVNIAGNVYGVSDGSGTLQIRSREWANIATEAKVTAVTPSGTYSGAIPVFRGDRSAAVSERIHLAGVVAGGDLFVQETGGSNSTVAIEFLDASGNAAGATRTESVSAYSLLELRGVIPANAETVIITNGGGGAVTAYARATDATTGDSWSIVDWARFYRHSNEEPVRVPFADGRGSGGGKRHAVRSSSAVTPDATRGATDLVLFNPTTSEVRATLQLVATNGSTSERSITVAPRATITVRDVGGSTPSTTAHAVVTPLRGSLVVTARSHYGTYGSAIPVLAATAGLRLGQSQVFSSLEDSSAFRTSYGLVETSGAPVSVRARILIGGAYALVTATTTRTFDLAPRQQVFLPELLRSFAGAARDGFGDLHDLTLQFEVVSGEGSVVPFVVVTDGGTGDTVLRVQ